MPIWLTRWALLQLAVRKGEYWEMRSLGVIKAPCSAPLPGWGWLLSSRQQLLSSWCGELGVGLGAQPAWARLSLGQGALAQHTWCHLPLCWHTGHVWEPCTVPRGLGTHPHTGSAEQGGGQAQALAILKS